MNRFLLFLSFFLTGSYISAQCSVTNLNTDLIISANQSLTGTYNIQGTFRVNAGITVTVTPYSSNNCGELIINADNIEILGTIDADGAGFDGGQGGLSQSSGVNTSYLTSIST